MRANTGRSYCNFSNLFRTFWLWFTFDKRNNDTKCTGISKSEYLLSATCFQTPEFFLNECLNILSKGWLKRLVVYLKLHYTGWMACLFSLRIHSNNHRKSYVSSDLFPFLTLQSLNITSYLNPKDCFQINFCLGQISCATASIDKHTLLFKSLEPPFILLDFARVMWNGCSNLLKHV